MNETLPPRVRPRWLLITIRLSIISLAGMVRTDVATGTVSEASMLVASDLDIPLRIVTWSSSVSSATMSITPVAGACAGIG